MTDACVDARGYTDLWRASVVLIGMPCCNHRRAASLGSIVAHRFSWSNASARCSRSLRSTLGHCS